MATDMKEQIELECQQVQEQLMKLTADREFLRKEFNRITSCSQSFLQQIQDDTSQSSEAKKSKFEVEKEKLEEKLRALESNIAEKDEKIESLDSKASDYLLQVNTLSNSLYDSPGDSINENLHIDGNTSNTGKEGAAEVLQSIVPYQEIHNGDRIPEQESEPLVTVCCIPDHQQSSAQQEANISEVPDSETNLNVEVKTVINLVMEDVPVVSKLPRESIEMSEACSKAILATNQVIENLHEQMEKSEVPEIPVCDNQLKNLASVSEKETDNDKIDARIESGDNEFDLTVGDGYGGCKSPQESKASVGVEMTKEEIVDEQPLESPVTISEKALPGYSEVTEIKPIEPPSSPPTPTKLPSINTTETGKPSNGTGSPVREQMMSLSLLVSELRRVKDDMGKCMSVKEQSFIELEDQLQAANKEVTSLKMTVSHMTKNLEEKERSYQALEEENMKKKMDIELKMKEVQEVTNKCSMLSGEKSDILRKMEVLEIMMTEYRTEIEVLIAEKTKLEEDTKQLLSAKTATSVAEAEIDSRTNVEEKEKEIEELVEKIQSMEKQMKELNDKLKVTNKHLKVMAREREHKQKECEVLKHKVELVELKMCELQGTFDMLVKAVMVERDELIKEMEEKNGQIDDVHLTLAQLKETHEQELEKVMYDKKALQEELSKYRKGELKSVAMVEQKELEILSQEKEKLILELKQQTEQKDVMEKKVKSIQHETNDFIVVLKDEMSRLREESEKTKLERKSLEETFTSLQSDHLEMTFKYQSMEKSFQELEQSNKEKTVNLEVLKLQLDDLQQQLEDLNTKNFNLSSEMYSKEEEFREELSAREGTIQELNVTLTNNQKQSMENYNALQEDMNSLQTKYKTSLEDNKKHSKDMEDKLKQLQEDKKTEILDLQGKVKSLMEELKDAKSALTESQTSYHQECESPSMSQDVELQSSSLAVAPSLPLDTVADSTSTSCSLPTEAECREFECASENLEDLKKKGKELQELLKVMNKKLEAKETEVHILVESSIPQLNEKIKQLSGELEELKAKSPGEETFNSQAEFEAVIAKKEERIRDLESKVADLEHCLVNKNGYISQLEERLDGKSNEKNDLESELQQISQLSSNISKLKEELKESHEKCQALKQTVNQLEREKESLEQEKTKIVEEYEGKLQGACGSLEEVQADLEEKKNSVERLEFELRTCRSSHVEVVANLESNHIDRVAEVVKFHQRKADELKSSNLAKISELHEHIDELYKTKKSLENQIGNLQLEYKDKMSKAEENWTEEKKEKEILMKKVILLEKEKSHLEDETGALKNGFEREQLMSANMQDQMVSDLEKLILGLESDKKDMEKEVQQLKSLRDLQSNIILDNEKKISVLGDEMVIANKENIILKEEAKKLKMLLGDENLSKYEDYGKLGLIEELTEKIDMLKNRLVEARKSAQEQEDIYAFKLREEKDDHIAQLRALRKEMAQEVDDIELKRKQLSLDYEDKIALMAADYQDHLKETIRRYETQLSEEKAEFGRVLVTKIDEYERKLLVQSTDEASCYESQINALQTELEKKSVVIEDLEQNLDEMTLVKAALRAQVDDLKLTVTKLGEGGEKSSLDVLHAEYESRLTEIHEHYESQLGQLRSIIQGLDIEVQTDGPSEAQRECCSSPSLCSEYSIELSCLRPYLQGQSSPITDLMADHRCHSSHGSEVDPLDHSFHFLSRSASAVKNKEDNKMAITLSSLNSNLLSKNFSKENAEQLPSTLVTHALMKSSSKVEMKPKLPNICVPVNLNNNSKIQKEAIQGTGIDTVVRSARLSVTSLKCTEGMTSANYTTTNVNPDTSMSSESGARPRPPRRNLSKMRSSPAVELYAITKEGTESANNPNVSQPSDVNPNTTGTLHKYLDKTNMSSVCCVVQ